MNRLGCTLLALFLIAGAAFFLMIRPVPESVPRAPAPEARPSRIETPQGPGGLVIPVAGVRPEQLVDTFQDARGNRTHGALDIMAPRGTPVVASAPGTVEKIFESEAGGHTISIRSHDGRWVHYYAHLDRYADGLTEGKRVSRGEIIGAVGSTGNANPEGPHLHFEVKRMAPGEKWYQGTGINPYPLLAPIGTAR